jgi:hypothetical protein
MSVLSQSEPLTAQEFFDREIAAVELRLRAINEQQAECTAQMERLGAEVVAAEEEMARLKLYQQRAAKLAAEAAELKSKGWGSTTKQILHWLRKHPAGGTVAEIAADLRDRIESKSANKNSIISATLKSLLERERVDLRQVNGTERYFSRKESP